MTEKRWWALGGILVGLGLIVSATPAAGAISFACVPSELPSLPGNTRTVPVGTDDAGTFVGFDNSDILKQGVSWRDGVPTSLGNFVPADMNRHGLIVGQDFFHAAILQDGVITPLPELDGFGSEAIGVNDRGDVVGRAFATGGPRAVIWPRGNPRTIRVLDPEPFAQAVEIDNGGLIIGTVGFPGSTVQKIWRADGTVVRTYSVDPAARNFLLADIAAGRVVAQEFGQNQQPDIVVIDALTGGTTAVPDSVNGSPNDINARGVIVGTRNGPTMWRNHRVVPLPLLPDTFAREPAAVVSRDGRQVVGVSTDITNTRNIVTLWTCGRS